jgi:hypothetical protein
MFGPDKCGPSGKIHFIMKDRDPMTGQLRESQINHSIPFKDDTLTHLYTLSLFHNDFSIFIDKIEVFSGNLLTHMTPTIDSGKEPFDVGKTDSTSWPSHPHMLISALAVEVWVTNTGIFFDNFVVARSIEDAFDVAQTTFDLIRDFELLQEQQAAVSRQRAFREHIRSTGGFSGAVQAAVMELFDMFIDYPAASYGSLGILLASMVYLVACGGKGAPEALAAAVRAVDMEDAKRDYDRVLADKNK